MIVVHLLSSQEIDTVTRDQILEEVIYIALIYIWTIYI